MSKISEMPNGEKILNHLRKNMVGMVGPDENKIREVWKKSQGDDLDALMIRTRVFAGLPYCFRCGRLLDFVVNTNGSPHCLGPCEFYAGR